MDEHLIDKRILEREIKRGKLDASEYRRLLERLPDRSDMAQRVELEPEPRPQPKAEPKPEPSPAVTPTYANPSVSDTAPRAERIEAEAVPDEERDEEPEKEPEVASAEPKEATSPSDGF
jgi:hypothetical protein